MPLQSKTELLSQSPVTSEQRGREFTQRHSPLGPMQCLQQKIDPSSPPPHGFYWGQRIDSDLYVPLKRSQTSQFSNVSDSLSGSKSAILDSLQDRLPLTFLSVKGKGSTKYLGPC